jgi:uncharacterized protein (UPF0335 family)
MEVAFHREVPAEAVISTVERLQRNVRQAHPEIQDIFVEAKALPQGR